LSVATGVSLFLFNLGLPLMTASLVFAGLAGLAFVFARWLSRRDNTKSENRAQAQ
jgi:membrane protein implicated in regulation of membrane protease activity